MKWLENFIDNTARRPGGWLGRAIYRESTAHRPGFERIKAKLALRPHERVLEVGCGGGKLLQEMLELCADGCAIDYSADMVALAAERNAAAVRDGRLDLRQGDAHLLPWLDASCDAAASAYMFFFVERPREMLREIARVLKPGGRLVIVTISRSKLVNLFFALYSRAMRCYSDDELAEMMREAGFEAVRVHTEKHRLQLAYGRTPT
ncbi:MAG: 27-O-demethylrifamycin SV methyltransferase [Chloroflexi bacterium]|nr:27-O-demethylrifamycin SV methyltransferase [Chloroflexota bacterium]